ncbi:MAG: cellulase family glycosylhydrolase [Candidatus Omnitrophota bacterium]|nr:glycoside hydrolase family 5 protein [Candidatus Omnitrophota bacterium]
MKIKGVNLGSWLLMEGYILGGRNIAEHMYKRTFKAIYGNKGLVQFEDLFRNNFITEADFRNIAAMGAGAVRVPFNYRLFECDAGFRYFDTLFSWAGLHNLGVILDMHAAPGAQNCDWHADSAGQALFWNIPAYRQRACLLWEKIVDRYKDEPKLIGYDVLNEPVIGKKNPEIVARFYRQAIRRIRAIDSTHTLFLEGDIWAQRVEYLRDLIEENIEISIHTYLPLNYTFNFRPFYSFPGTIDAEQWNKEKLYRYLESYHTFSRDNKVRIFVGEFGINWRGGFFGEETYLSDMLDIFDEFDFDYTYWTYKAVAGHAFPDGLYQSISDSRYVCREGPVYGWETYYRYWKKERNNIVDFWRTKNFTVNTALTSILKKHFAR